MSNLSEIIIPISVTLQSYNGALESQINKNISPDSYPFHFSGFLSIPKSSYLCLHALREQTVDIVVFKKRHKKNIIYEI